MLLHKVNPKNLIALLKEIDQSPPSYRANRETSSFQVMLIVLSICISLLISESFKNTHTMNQVLDHISTLLGYEPNEWTQQLTNSPLHSLLPKVWWALILFISYMIIPVVVIKVFLKEKLRDFGLSWADTSQHWRSYLYLALPLPLLVVFASQQPEFTSMYPFHKNASKSWFDLVSWELLYLIQFISLEFFYRGYILRALRPHMGSAAIGVMLIPYMMIHFGKPLLETTGSIFFGLILGVIAMRSRSIWGGVMIHAGLAFSLDILCILKQGQLPTVIFP